jgi:hypothetical protein
VSRPRFARSIRLALALLGFAAFGGGARVAHAMGCHAAERPSLGLELRSPAPIAEVQVLHPEARPSAPILVRIPCSGDVPDSAGRTMPPRDLPPVYIEARPPLERRRRLPPSSCLAFVPPPGSRLERPPRFAPGSILAPTFA